MAIAGAIVAGGAAIMLLVASGVANAASPTTSAQPAASAAVSHTSANNPFGRTETVSDQSVVAGVLGITEAQLDTALSSGQTVAAVAKAHNVDPQKMIDVVVTDGLNELAAQVKAGTLTQAQADTQKAAVTQRATDQVQAPRLGRSAGNPALPRSRTGPRP
jgi:hypothetical protein